MWDKMCALYTCLSVWGEIVEIRFWIQIFRLLRWACHYISSSIVTPKMRCSCTCSMRAFSKVSLSWRGLSCLWEREREREGGICNTTNPEAVLDVSVWMGRREEGVEGRKEVMQTWWTTWCRGSPPSALSKHPANQPRRLSQVSIFTELDD